MSSKDELLAENLEFRAALKEARNLLVDDLNRGVSDKEKNDVLRLVRFALTDKYAGRKAS